MMMPANLPFDEGGFFMDFGPPNFLVDILNMIPDFDQDGAEVVSVETFTTSDGKTTRTTTTTNLRKHG